MYTGIVDHCGIIINLIRHLNSLEVWIQSQFPDVQMGESIAVDGVCLTATEPRGSTFRCDLSPETCRLTTLKNLQVGAKVNLERSLTLQDRLGGHFVMGHVDKVATIKTIVQHHDYREIRFNGFTATDQLYLTQKGCISIHGVSLTINEVFPDGFSVMLIPHTLERTNLANLSEGSTLNIEFDMLARIVAKQLQDRRIVA